MQVWIVVQECSYPTIGVDGAPMLNVTHKVTHFNGGDCKFGSGLEVVGIFESERDACAYVAHLDANGVVLYPPPEPRKAGELPEGQRPTLRVFLMLEELHRRGYQQLRIVPGMSGSGIHYRSSITSAANVSATNGAIPVDFDQLAPNTSANDGALFGWDDAAESSIAELARMFIRRYPSLAKIGRAPDQPYVDWFKTALKFARRGDFPIAYTGDSFGRVVCVGSRTYLPTLGAGDERLPMPPPGLHSAPI